MFYEKEHSILEAGTLPSSCNLDTNYSSSEDVAIRLWSP